MFGPLGPGGDGPGRGGKHHDRWSLRKKLVVWGCTALAGVIVLCAVSLALLSLLPVDFGYVWFGLLLFVFGVGNGLFVAPNRAAVMNCLPPWRRGVGSGIASTFQNSGQVFSIGIYFSLMIIGLSARLRAYIEPTLELIRPLPASAVMRAPSRESRAPRAVADSFRHSPS